MIRRPPRSTLFSLHDALPISPVRGPDAGPDGRLFRVPARARRRAPPEPVPPGARRRRAGGAGGGPARRPYAAPRSGTGPARARAARILLATLGRAAEDRKSVV